MIRLDVADTKLTIAEAVKALDAGDSITAKAMLETALTVVVEHMEQRFVRVTYERGMGDPIPQHDSAEAQGYARARAAHIARQSSPAVAAIDRFNEEMAQYRAERGLVECPNCGASVRADADCSCEHSPCPDY